MNNEADDPLASSTMSTGSAVDPLSFSGFGENVIVSPGEHRGSFIAEEERNLPEVR
jgi:hypothetical protein